MLRWRLGAVIARWPRLRLYASSLSRTSWVKGLLTGERDMNYGNPIDISDLKRLNDEIFKRLLIVSSLNLIVSMKKLWAIKQAKTKPLTYIYQISLPLGYYCKLYYSAMAFDHVKLFFIQVASCLKLKTPCQRTQNKLITLSDIGLIEFLLLYIFQILRIRKKYIN